MLREMRATLRFGLSVDSYLHGLGALAQAVDSCTMLVSSSVLAMNRTSRQLIFLHELAHMRQLATPGNDPVQALEDEAWEAAHAWGEGRHYLIRGQARGRLNALAIIQGGEKGHPHAPAWYRTSPEEPIGSSAKIKIDAVRVLDSMNLEAIVDTILASRGITETLIVSHGSGDGLAIPIRRGSVSGAQSAIIVAFASESEGEEVSFDGTKIKTPAMSDKDVADLARIHEQQVKALRAKMNQVRGMKLKHVAFRACNMGINKDTMKAFRDFFGARSVSAPTLFDSYGRFAPHIHAGLADWVKVQQKQGYKVAIDDGVAFGIKFGKSSIVYTIKCGAESRDDFTKWVKKHIAEGAWTSDGVIFHGMVPLHPDPTGPFMYFVRDSDFVSSLVTV